MLMLPWSGALMNGAAAPTNRWAIGPKAGIVWNVSADARLPHSDHVEMSGRRVSVIVRYSVDAQRRLAVTREIVWPTLRRTRDDVRGYLVRRFGSEAEPTLRVDGKDAQPGAVERIEFDGVLRFVHAPADSLQVTRALFPSPTRGDVLELWRVRNAGRLALGVDVSPPSLAESAEGIYGTYEVRVTTDRLKRPPQALKPGEALTFAILYSARRAEWTEERPAAKAELDARLRFVSKVTANLRLETPDPVLNRAFELAKLRTAESVFDTKMGRVHSPGGGRYYGGIWANDQAEYAGPFFPFLGEAGAEEASLNAYRIYASAMTPDFEMLPSSFEVEGDVRYHAGGDRGDAAMVAYGAARFALAHGDPKTGEELWPAVEWCLEYCRRKTNAHGVVASDTDELEGRFPTGNANLSTSTLAYGALRSAAHLGRALGHADRASEYDRRADELRGAIERTFGAEVEGFRTYRYYDGNTVLRAWICLPLVMQIDERRDETVRALFSPRLWTDDGLATQAGDKTFWDRSTLYALRGVFASGETQIALRYLRAYSERRLLGDHVPYPVEAWPEGGQAHLAAESALYCRIFTEGLFGIEPTGFRSFRCRPRLPDAWPSMALRRMMAFGGPYDLAVTRTPAGLRLTVRRGPKAVFDETRPAGQAFHVQLPDSFAQGE